MAKKESPFHLEKALQELEVITEKMETGQLPLEESLKLFERGIALSRQCQHQLEKIEQKIQILTEKNGQSNLTELP